MLDSFRLQSAAEQVASHLRDAISSRNLAGEMPGTHQLAAELEVNHKTVSLALKILESEDLILSKGRGKRREIIPPKNEASSSLRVGIFCIEPTDSGAEPLVDLQHLLGKAGHVPFFPNKTLTELGMDVKQIARYVKSSDADAWILIAASREVLEWFANEPTPAFALFGRRHSVDIAGVGPRSIPAMEAIMDRLIGLGHERIVMLSREMRRLPLPSEFEQRFLKKLESHGISVGGYNLPAWEESREGFQSLLKSLFQLTPPTALIVHEPHQVVALLQFFAKNGIRTPEDVSMVCLDPDYHYRWCQPTIAHIYWPLRRAAKIALDWTNRVSQGKDDRKQTSVRAEFIEGGTIGLAPGKG